MPPVNTPAHASPGPGSPDRRPQTPSHDGQHRPLTPLSYLSSPVPDLAATLRTLHANDQADIADEENVDFLRDSLESLDRLDEAQDQSTRSRVESHRDPRLGQDYQLQLRLLQQQLQQPDQPSQTTAPPRRQDYELQLALIQQQRQQQQGQQQQGQGQQQSDQRPQNTTPPRRQDYELQLALLQQQRQQSDQRPQTTAPTRRQETADDLSRRERLQRVLARLNRMHEPVASSTSSAYTNRTPSPHRQSLYDWAPAYDEHSQDGDGELDALTAELRRQQSDTPPEILRLLAQSHVIGSERENTSETGTHMQSSDAAAERRRQDRIAAQRVRNTARAVLQRARHESSPSATERMLRYVMDRERSGLSEEEERARGQGWFRPSPTRVGEETNANGNAQRGESVANDRDGWLLPPRANEIRERDRQERVEAFRRGYLAENGPHRQPRISTPPVPTPAATTNMPAPAISTNSSSPFLENALKYLSQLRSCERYEEALATAIDNSLATKEFFADKRDDFVLDLEELNPPAFTSWLQPGAVFQGHQHASSASMNLRHHPQLSHTIEQINPQFRPGNSLARHNDQPPGSAPIAHLDPSRPWMSYHHTPPGPGPRAPSSANARLRASSNAITTPSTKTPADAQHDHWPVRVVIHAIDPVKMTVQGTMEAYDVPQHPANPSVLQAASAAAASSSSIPSTTSSTRPKAGRKSAPIITYLEGHILDLRTHTFLTPSPTSKSQPQDSTTTTPTITSPLSETIHFPAASPATDAANWRRLPPFDTLASADEMGRLLLSRERLNDLNDEFVFMRWKERCFVHSAEDVCPERDGRMGDRDRGHGLTISGFYYVVLKRGDGSVEGLYFDPTSTPYQHLRLKASRGGWPSWSFK